MVDVLDERRGQDSSGVTSFARRRCAARQSPDMANVGDGFKVVGSAL